MLVENIAFDKLVEAHWSGEDKVWHTLRAEYHSSAGANREVWRAQASFNPSDDASLPGDIEFALRYRVLGEDYWDNNESRNYFSNADSGVLLEQNVQLLNIDFNPILQDGQQHYPITVAVRQSLQPKHMFETNVARRADHAWPWGTAGRTHDDFLTDGRDLPAPAS